MVKAVNLRQLRVAHGWRKTLTVTMVFAHLSYRAGSAVQWSTVYTLLYQGVALMRSVVTFTSRWLSVAILRPQ